MHRPSPDRAALEIAHIKIRAAAPLDEVLKDPSLKIIVEAVARRHMLRRDRPDLKKRQANDHD
jgi:hypothetical protein